MENNKEILALSGAEESGIIASEKDIELIIATAEKQVEVLKKVLGIAVKRTNPTDWLDQNGKPYLTSSGAEKLMPLFGVSLNSTAYEKKYFEDDKGQYYIYHYKGTFFWKGGSIEAIGACSSRDKFFAWNSYDKTYKTLGEVDDINIMKAAYSNMMVNGITRLLGIRNLTWEVLDGLGVKKDHAAKVEYKNGHTDFTLISEAQRKRLFAIAASKKMSEEKLKEHLKTKYGITTSKEIRREFYDDIVLWVENYKAGE